MNDMNTTHTPFVKVCGQTHHSSIDNSIALGARMCGFVFHPKSPRSVSPRRAALLESGPLKRVGVFVEQNAAEILDAMEVARLDYAQLHGDQDTACAEAVGPERVIRVLWPQRYHSIDELQREVDRWADCCAFFLLDGGCSGGGTGAVWDASQAARLRFPRPWILAGGLTPGNLAEAVAACRPDGVDLNSGVEMAPGLKCADKLLAAFRALDRAA